MSDKSFALLWAGLARQYVEQKQAALACVCYGLSFDSILAALSAQAGLRPDFQMHSNGTLQTHKVGKIKIAEIKMPARQDQIALAGQHMPAEVAHRLVAHPETAFFVNRTPTWLGNPLPNDQWGQRLNGVLDIESTADPRYPVWTPIQADVYRQYLSPSGAPGKQDAKTRPAARLALCRQILTLLDTARRNLIADRPQGAGEVNASVIERTLPLWDLVILGLTQKDPVEAAG